MHIKICFWGKNGPYLGNLHKIHKLLYIIVFSCYYEENKRGGLCAMLKRSLSFILCLAFLLVMAPGALAAGEYLVVTLEPGDSVYGLCQSFGIDYNAQKYEIMRLNGFENEFQMSNLGVGSVILLPPPMQIVSNVIYDSFGQDEIAFYVVPYVSQPGDSITNIYQRWGLNYEPVYALICALNGVDSLNWLTVGATYYLPTTGNNVYTDSFVTVLAHVVRPGETAFSIFTDYGIDYYRYAGILWAFNAGVDLTDLRVGQKVMIPVV